MPGSIEGDIAALPADRAFETATRPTRQLVRWTVNDNYGLMEVVEYVWHPDGSPGAVVKTATGRLIWFRLTDLRAVA